VNPEIAIAVLPEGKVYVRQGADVPAALASALRVRERWSAKHDQSHSAV